MSATMKDGKGQLLVLAWGTAPIENGAHWKWLDTPRPPMSSPDCRREDEGADAGRPDKVCLMAKVQALAVNKVCSKAQTLALADEVL
jgi:hypothetical protein